MPIRDQVAMEKSLDNDYGPTRGANSPDEFEVALFSGDPENGGLEISDETEIDLPGGGIDVVANGYARAVLDNDDWDPAAGGIKSAEVTFAAPTQAWETITHWGLYDPVEGVWWDCAPFAEPLDVTGAGPAVDVTLSVFYDNLPEG